MHRVENQINITIVFNIGQVNMCVIKHIFEKISLYLSVQKSITEWNFLAHTALSSD